MNDTVKFIVCACKRNNNEFYSDGQWYAIHCEYLRNAKEILVYFPNDSENFYSINNFEYFWDLPAGAGILGIIDQAEKGLF